MFVILVVVGTLLLLGHTQAAHHPQGHKGEEFNYDVKDLDDGPKVWDGECLKGFRQSPIDIRYKEQGIAWAYTKINFNPQYHNYHKGFYATNRGHTLQVQLNGNKTDPNSLLELSGAGLKQRYTFAQLHFHWGDRDEVGSEHVVQGQRYPLEIHFVHYKSKYRHLGSALDDIVYDREAVVVFAVLCELGEENLGLRPIIDLAKMLRDPAPKLKYSSRSLNIWKLLPKNLDFVRYLGSLTTPPCTEKVSWSVFLCPIKISSAQLETLRTLRDNDDKEYYNYRPLQMRNERKLTYYQVTSPNTDGNKMLQQTLTTTLEDINSLFNNFIGIINDNDFCEDNNEQNNENIIPPTFFYQKQRQLNNSSFSSKGKISKKYKTNKDFIK